MSDGHGYSAAVLSIACPFCRAQAGRRCYEVVGKLGASIDGSEKARPHPSRTRHVVRTGTGWVRG